jgi:hypothetical protein
VTQPTLCAYEVKTRFQSFAFSNSTCAAAAREVHALRREAETAQRESSRSAVAARQLERQLERVKERSVGLYKLNPVERPIARKRLVSTLANYEVKTRFHQKIASFRFNVCRYGSADEDRARFDGLEEKIANRERMIQELRRERNALLVGLFF